MTGKEAVRWESAISGALTYHAAALLALSPGIFRDFFEGLQAYLHFVQALAVIPVLVIARGIVARIWGTEQEVLSTIGSDLLIFGVFVGIIALVSLPGNLRGTATLGLMIMIPLGTVVVTSLSALSLVVRRFRIVQLVLGALVVANILATVVSVGMMLR